MSDSVVLNLENQNLNNDSFIQLLVSLPDEVKYQVISVRNNHISDIGVEALMNYVKTHNHIRRLDLRGNNIGARGCQRIIDDIFSQNDKKLNDKWIEFLLGDNHLGDEGAKIFANNIHAWKTLDLSHNHIEHSGIKYLADKLADNDSLRSLALCYNNFGDEAGEYLITKLKENNSIQTLNICGCNIGTKTMTSLCELFKTNTTITSLDVSNNRLNDDQIKLLCKGIINSNLKALYINSNREITSKGIEYICTALELGCSCLMSIDIRDIALNDSDGEKLKDAIKKHSNIISVHMTPGIAEKNLLELKTVVENNVTRHNRWIELAMLTLSLQANHKHTLNNSVYPLIEICQEFVFPTIGRKTNFQTNRRKFERMAALKFVESHIN
jgi:Ran GTPase-activating protein (RanGAP) involved in mRNA processing and transport